MRRLRCIRCAETVKVDEIPCEHIDPGLFVCGACHRPVEAPQLQLHEQTETRQYDPAVAAFPEGF